MLPGGGTNSSADASRLSGHKRAVPQEFSGPGAGGGGGGGGGSAGADQWQMQQQLEDKEQRIRDLEQQMAGGKEHASSVQLKLTAVSHWGWWSGSTSG